MDRQEKYRELITYLDCALTGKPYAECLHTFDSVNTPDCIVHIPEKFIMGDVYYLSDGGYSRLCWDLWNDKGVYVASESLNGVKEAFKRCKELISDLNDFLFPIQEEL